MQERVRSLPILIMNYELGINNYLVKSQVSLVAITQFQIIPSLPRRSMVSCCVWIKCLRSTSLSSIVFAG